MAGPLCADETAEAAVTALGGVWDYFLADDLGSGISFSRQIIVSLINEY